MKTFRCNNCGHQIQRPTQPYQCPQCGRQAVGLFKLLPAGSPPQGTPRTAQPAVPPAQAGAGASPPAATRLPMPPQPPGRPAQTAAVPPPPPAQPTSPPPSPAIPSPGAEPAAPQTRGALPQAPPTPTQPKAASRPGARPAPTQARPTAPRSQKSTAQPPRSAQPADVPSVHAAPRPKARPKPVRPERFVWAFPEQPPEGHEATPLRNAPAVDARGLIFLHACNRLVALEEEDGRPTVRWEYVTGCHAPGATVLAPDGSLRLHAGDGCLHGLSAAGKQLWPPIDVGEPLGYAAPMVDGEGNTWICACDGGLIQCDAQGRMQKRGRFFRARQKLNARGIIHEGVLYVGSEEGCVFAIRLGGQRGVNLWNHAAGQGETGWYLRATPALTDDGILVVAGCDEHLYGFRLDGNPAWKTQVPGQMLGSAVLDRSGHVYVGLSQSQRGQQPRGLLACVDGNSHKIRWQYEAAGPVESTPVVGDDDVIYCGDNTGLIHAVDSRGNVQWTAQVEAAVRSSGAILAPERLAFGLDNAALVVLRCSSRPLTR